ncbi:MAG: FAD-dependent oxidoreductase [Caulobacteraceae bacterium]|nr:FAD-dependent oxidoreductase [Caulobacter sp.]
MSEEKKLPDLARGVAAADLAEGAMIKGAFGEAEVVVARTKAGVFAVSAACTHLGAPLDEGLLIGGQLRCPWHHARFDVATGEAVGAPAFQPLGCFAVEEVDGRVRVTGRRAPAAKAEAEAAQAPGRVLIVGGGAAGYACAEMLARLGLGAGVTVVSDDADAPYDRTFCSKQYLSGEAPRGKTALAEEGFWSDAGPRLRLGARVAKLDLEAHEAELEGGERLGWDVLVLATGAEPQRPEAPGFDDPSVHLLRTLADADALIAAAGHAQRVAIVGASFIGMEAAAALTQRGLKVTVVAPESIPLAATLGDDAGRFLQQMHEKKGVAFRLGRKAVRLDRRALMLDDGASVEADLVVVGQGVTPRVDLARAAGLALDDATGGVRVDDRLRAAPDVFAVGDIAAYPGPVGEVIRVEHWVHAERQGQHVARVIAGEDARYADLPFFWTNHYGTSVDYDGHAEEIAGVRLQGDVAQGAFAVTLIADGRDAAFVTVERNLEALRWEAAHEPA